MSTGEWRRVFSRNDLSRGWLTTKPIAFELLIFVSSVVHPLRIFLFYAATSSGSSISPSCLVQVGLTENTRDR